MSQADEMLESFTADEVFEYSGGLGADEEHIVIGSDRSISVPASLRNIAVQFDHNVETVTFDCPRRWDGIDMSDMQVTVHYELPDGSRGAYFVEGVRTDAEKPDIMYIDWLISRNVTQLSGFITVLISIKRLDERGRETFAWNSERCSDFYISEGMNGTTSLQKQYPDIIEQLRNRVVGVDSSVINGADLTDMLNEEMPVDISVVDELYKLIDGQEALINGGVEDGTEGTV